MRRHTRRVVTVEPALPELAALLAAMRPDWDAEQVLAELIAAETGSGWSVHLAVEALRATKYDEPRLRLPGLRAYGRPGGQPATPEQRAAIAAYARRRLARNKENPDA